MGCDFDTIKTSEFARLKCAAGHQLKGVQTKDLPDGFMRLFELSADGVLNYDSGFSGALCVYSFCETCPGIGERFSTFHPWCEYRLIVASGCVVDATVIRLDTLEDVKRQYAEAQVARAKFKEERAVAQVEFEKRVAVPLSSEEFKRLWAFMEDKGRWTLQGDFEGAPLREWIERLFRRAK